MDANLTRRSAIQWAGGAFVLPTVTFQPNLLENGPMPFTPKFADLVRNIATVSGTGPVTLGAAVSGFTSLADAVGIGDQFYYCLQGIDKPQEREVGRGTLQADGRVARLPIAGEPTNFTSGTKTIALVTPAEWFERRDGAMTTASDRSELAGMEGVTNARAYLAEGPRVGNFVFDPSDNSAMVAADPRQGLFVAPASDPSGASGAWVRAGWSNLDPAWFGAMADNSTDASPAINAAFRLAETLAVAGSTNGTIYRGGPVISLRPGKYYCASTWEPLATVRIQGAGGIGWGAATQVRFPGGVTGIRSQAHNTSGAATVDGSPHFSGDALVIQDIYFLGGFSDTEGDHHGIHAKRAVHLERCTFDGFQGDGIYGHSSFGGGGADEGNTNVLRLANCVFTNCRSGISAKGGDANAWNIINCSYVNNRRWGREDRSFLGNQEFGGHYDGNGRTSWSNGAVGRPCCYVSHGGNWYFAVDGQESWCSTNAPSGTSADNQGWGYWQSGGPSPLSGVPSWSSGMAVRSGGPILISGLNNASTVHAPHVETNGISQTDQLGLIIGGNPGGVVSVGQATLSRNRARVLYATAYGMHSAGNFVVDGDSRLNSPTNFLGPNMGSSIQDGTTVLASRNSGHTIIAQNFDTAGNPGIAYASFNFQGALGTILDTAEPRWHRFRIGGADIAHIETGGIYVEDGKALYNNGQKVVGSRGAPLPADATDLASAINLVNAIKARLKATGGHGLVSD